MKAETLSQKQRRFSIRLAELIQYVYTCGYECAIGEVSRSDEQSIINSLGEAGREKLAIILELAWASLAAAIRNNGKGDGIVKSVHQLRLAADLLIFKDGVYLTDSEAYRRFGEWWEKQGSDHRWGGRFKDGNHFSIEFNGVK